MFMAYGEDDEVEQISVGIAIPVNAIYEDVVLGRCGAGFAGNAVRINGEFGAIAFREPLLATIMLPPEKPSL